jgi:hypothetical protein
VVGYSDASLNVHWDGKGHTGLIVGLGQRANIYFQSVKQKLVTRSSTEAEIVAMDSLVMKVIQLRELMQDLGYKQATTKIYQDNKSAIIIASKGFSNVGKVKYINNRYYFIKQFIDSGEIQVIHLPTEDMVADILTKPLQGNQFQKLCSALMNEVNTFDRSKGYVGNKPNLKGATDKN